MNAGLLDGLMVCGNDGMPMIKIGDSYRCVVEYLGEQIGGATVSDLITNPATLIFSNGRSLPLLCTCCGDPLHINADAINEALSRVTGLKWDAAEWSADNPDEITLVFIKDDDDDDTDHLIPVHIHAIKQIL